VWIILGAHGEFEVYDVVVRLLKEERKVDVLS
jgi:hypothetical protein